MTVKDFYDRIGQDYAEVYERMLGSEELLIRFLKQFCEDETYAALSQAVKDGDKKQIFLEAHTLKGLSANLGLKPLCEKVSVLVELTRNDGSLESSESIVEAFSGIQEVYRDMVENIERIE